MTARHNHGRAKDDGWTTAMSDLLGVSRKTLAFKAGPMRLMGGMRPCNSYHAGYNRIL